MLRIVWGLILGLLYFHTNARSTSSNEFLLIEHLLGLLVTQQELTDTLSQEADLHQEESVRRQEATRSPLRECLPWAL